MNPPVEVEVVAKTIGLGVTNYCYFFAALMHQTPVPAMKPPVEAQVVAKKIGSRLMYLLISKSITSSYHFITSHASHTCSPR